jgi:hypothetical protein
MAAEGRLSHQSLNPVLSRCGGHAAAENVGMNSSRGPATWSRVSWLAAAPPTSSTGATPALIGAYRDARGVWWVTQDFVG